MNSLHKILTTLEEFLGLRLELTPLGPATYWAVSSTGVKLFQIQICYNSQENRWFIGNIGNLIDRGHFGVLKGKRQRH